MGRKIEAFPGERWIHSAKQQFQKYDESFTVHLKNGNGFTFCFTMKYICQFLHHIIHATFQKFYLSQFPRNVAVEPRSKGHLIDGKSVKEYDFSWTEKEFQIGLASSQIYIFGQWFVAPVAIER